MHDTKVEFHWPGHIALVVTITPDHAGQVDMYKRVIGVLAEEHAHNASASDGAVSVDAQWDEFRQCAVVKVDLKIGAHLNQEATKQALDKLKALEEAHALPGPGTIAELEKHVSDAEDAALDKALALGRQVARQVYEQQHSQNQKPEEPLIPQHERRFEDLINTKVPLLAPEIPIPQNRSLDPAAHGGVVVLPVPETVDDGA